MGQKIIFVDIDGPLIPGRMHLLAENHTSDPDAIPVFDNFSVRVFNLWAKYSNAKIVLSTNWAWSHDNEQLKLKMKMNGLGFDYHDAIVTPKRMNSNRHDEILDWLRKHSKEGDKFIAVDDDTTCEYIQKVLDSEHNRNSEDEIKATGKWIKVDFENGMTRQNFKDGCKALGIDRDDLMFKEFGIKKLTKEEAAKRDALLQSIW